MAAEDRPALARGPGIGFIPYPAQAEIDALVRGYTDAQLAENYQHAMKDPGTEWARLLSAEIGRRDAQGGSR